MKSGVIAIVGRPNSGKSSLLNAILGSELSIVTPKAQTTREKVLGIWTEEGLGQILFIDTPGIHRAREGGMNAFMVAEARSALDAPSLVGYLLDPDSHLDHEKPVLELLAPLAQAGVPVLILLTKADLNRPMAEQRGRAVAEALRTLGVTVQGPLSISVRSGTGLNELKAAFWAALPQGPLYYPDVDQVSDRPVRFFVAEKVREQLFLQLGDEIPYGCAVEIVRFDENAKPVRIEAVIHVERDSQKGMVIGKGGVKIKSIGQSARMKIQEFLGMPVFLGLQVEVLKDWTRNAEQLKRMGYVTPDSRL